MPADPQFLSIDPQTKYYNRISRLLRLLNSSAPHQIVRTECILIALASLQMGEPEKCQSYPDTLAELHAYIKKEFEDKEIAPNYPIM